MFLPKGQSLNSNKANYRGDDQVVVLILNWNGWKETQLCLESLRECKSIFSSIVIVDNGSSDGSIPRIRSFAQEKFQCELEEPKKDIIVLNAEKFSLEFIFLKGQNTIYLLCLEKNYGASTGRNIGVEWILKKKLGDYVFFLDNDAQVTPTTIFYCLKFLNNNPRFYLVNCVVKNFDESIQFAGLKFVDNMFYFDILLKKTNYDAHKAFWPVDMLTSNGLMVHYSSLEKVKEERGFIFDPDLYFYCEDQDLSLYAKKKLKLSNIVIKDAVIYHKISQGSFRKPKAYYFSSRNRIYLANRYMPLFLKMFFHLFYIPYRVGRALINFISGKPDLAKAHILGLIDGYRGVKGDKNI